MSEPSIESRVLAVESALFHALRDMKDLQAENHVLRELVVTMLNPEIRCSQEEAVVFLKNRKKEVLQDLLIQLESVSPELSALLDAEPERKNPPKESEA